MFDVSGKGNPMNDLFSPDVLRCNKCGSDERPPDKPVVESDIADGFEQWADGMGVAKPRPLAWDAYCTGYMAGRHSSDIDRDAIIMDMIPAHIKEEQISLRSYGVADAVMRMVEEWKRLAATDGWLDTLRRSDAGEG